MVGRFTPEDEDLEDEPMAGEVRGALFHNMLAEAETDDTSEGSSSLRPGDRPKPLPRAEGGTIQPGAPPPSVGMVTLSRTQRDGRRVEERLLTGLGVEGPRIDTCLRVHM
jgi:hypothetical protein